MNPAALRLICYFLVEEPFPEFFAAEDCALAAKEPFGVAPLLAFAVVD